MRTKKRNRCHNKSDSQFLHTASRFRQRYGMQYTKVMEANFIDQIQGGMAYHIETQSVRIRIFWVTWEARKYPVVYDRIRKTITSVLLPEMVGGKYGSDFI